MTDPIRLQLSRRRGFNLQKISQAMNGRAAIVVSRPGPFGNPFIVGRDGDAAHCVNLFTQMLCGNFALNKSVSVEKQRAARRRILDHRADLVGKNLACWCRSDRLCHADVLLIMAKDQLNSSADS